jgi:hypothetical protein
MNSKTVLSSLIGLLAIVALPAFATEITGSLTTGLGSGFQGTVVAIPTSNVAPGTYNANQTITLLDAGASSIRYTVDGAIPGCASTQYVNPFIVSSSQTVKAIGCYPNNVASDVAPFAYTLQCAVNAVANGAVAAYPACGITCNAGYTLSGNSCVSSGGGGGGGGGGNNNGIYGCMSPTAINYSPLANVDNGACLYASGTIGTSGTTGTTGTTGTSGTPEARQTLITQILAQIDALRAQLAALTGGNGATPNANALANANANASFKRDLKVGSVGDDVKALQVWLNTHGYVIAKSGLGSPGHETTKFGAFTRVALAKWQKANGITPAVGFFGAKTRKAINTQQ